MQNISLTLDNTQHHYHLGNQRKNSDIFREFTKNEIISPMKNEIVPIIKGEGIKRVAVKSLNNSSSSTSSKYMILADKNLQKILPVAKFYRVEEGLYIGFNRDMVKQLKLKYKQVLRLKSTNMNLFDWKGKTFEITEFVKKVFFLIHSKELVFKRNEGSAEDELRVVQIVHNGLEIARCKSSSKILKNIEDFLAIVLMRMTCTELFRDAVENIITDNSIAQSLTE